MVDNYLGWVINVWYAGVMFDMLVTTRGLQ